MNDKNSQPPEPNDACDPARDSDTLQPSGISPDDVVIDTSAPAGPPRPLRRAARGLNLAAGASIVLIAGSSTLYMLGGSTRSCRGATRSSHVQWQQRQAALQEALEAEQNSQPMRTPFKDSVDADEDAQR